MIRYVNKEKHGRRADSVAQHPCLISLMELV